MGNDIVVEGISIGNIGSNIYTTREGAELNLNVSIHINDENDDVAFQDAIFMQEVITSFLKDFVKDYSEDGQEVV